MVAAAAIRGHVTDIHQLSRTPGGLQPFAGIAGQAAPVAGGKRRHRRDHAQAASEGVDRGPGQELFDLRFRQMAWPIPHSVVRPGLVTRSSSWSSVLTWLWFPHDTMSGLQQNGQLAR
ncbi:hypothetical protein ACXX9E_29515 [Pseudomonas sp. GNP014]